MNTELTLRSILLAKLNRVLNPNFESKYIWTLLTAGISLVGYQRLVQLASSLEVFSDTTYVKLSLSNSTDKIFIILGCLMIAFSILIYFLRLVNHPNSGRRKYKSLKSASKEIRRLIDDNRRVFTAFGPNTDAGTIDRLRMDYEVWESLKTEQVCPNNDQILNILNSVRKLDSNEEPIVFEMKSHIQAFKKHCEDPSFDYTGNQFPVAFSDLIMKYCAGNENSIEIYSDWFRDQLSHSNCIIDSVYLFGSALYGQEKYDVDVLIKTAASELNEIENDAIYFTELKNRFASSFNLKLHLKVYSDLEQDSYEEFIKKVSTVERIV